MDVATRPILMHAWSVRGILNGRKTQTRRIVKPQPDVSDWSTSSIDGHWAGASARWAHHDDIPALGNGWYIEIPGMCEGPYRCPYGQPGDMLYVRETWAIRGCGRRVSLAPEAWPNGFPVDRIQYIATDEAPATDEKGQPYWWNSRPSIHMPKALSRLWLRVTGVRVERVQEISAGDCYAEGVVYSGEGFDECLDPRIVFEALWDDTNGPGAWERNDWVWALTFERVEAE